MPPSQHWQAAQYQHNAAFVAAYGTDVLAWLAPQPRERILIWAAVTARSPHNWPPAVPMYSASTAAPIWWRLHKHAGWPQRVWMRNSSIFTPNLTPCFPMPP